MIYGQFVLVLTNISLMQQLTCNSVVSVFVSVRGKVRLGLLESLSGLQHIQLF